MRKIEITIRGPKAVDVGYRPFLLLNAMNFGIGKVFAYNLEGAVRVRVQGAEEKIDQYLHLIRSARPQHAEVDGVEVTEFEGEVMRASVFLQFLQFEQINKAIPAILSIDKKQDIMIGKQDIMIGKQDIMIGKQDIMIGKQDIMIGKQDAMVSKQDQTLDVLEGVREDTSLIRKDVSSIKNDISTLARQTTLEDLEKKYEMLSRDVAEIKAEISEIKAS
jgi:acylphosphatase